MESDDRRQLLQPRYHIWYGDQSTNTNTGNAYSLNIAFESAVDLKHCRSSILHMNLGDS